MNVVRILLMILLPLLIVGAGVFGAQMLIEARVEPEKAAPVVEPPLVRVVEAEPETVRLRVQAEGEVQPRTQTQLVPEVSGRVIRISQSLAAGGFFEQGEALVEIAPREYELAVTRAKAAVAQAKTALAREEQEAAVARKEWQELGEGEASPLVLREPQLAEARAALASAEAALQQAEYDLERTILRAPYDGRVRSKNVDVGQFVQKGAPLATVYSTDAAEVRLPVPDDQLAFIRVPLAYRDSAAPASSEDLGPSVVLKANFAGETYSWRGHIVRTEGEIDPETRMVQLVAQVRNPYDRAGSRPPLAVGMFVEAEIQGKAVQAIPLPRSAVRGGNTVLVVGSDSRIEFREIDILRAEEERVLVSGGVESGELVCVSNLEAAVEGMRVRTTGADAELGD